MPKLSIEGALGIAVGVILFILDKMGIGGTPVYAILFVVAMGLCVDSIIRSEWATSSVRRKAWGGIGMAVFYLVFGAWIFLRPHKKAESENRTPTVARESASGEKKEPPKTETPPTVKKKAPAKPTGKSDTPLFAVAVETKMLVPGPSKETAGIGLWGVSRGGANCIMWSADLAVFIRIRNLQSTRVMITAYNVSGMGGEYRRIRLDLSEPFRFVQRGRIPVPMQMPPGSGNVNGGFFQVKFEETDFSRGYPAQAEFLDRQIGEHYIEPNGIVRGWALFEYPNNATIPVMLTIKITDDLGHVSSYPVPDEAGNRLGDTLPRVMTYGSPIDLSSCIRQPHPAPLQ